MATIICENCGTENPDSVKFCKQCGARLATAVAVPAPVMAAPAAAMAATAAWPAAAGQVAGPFERRYGALRGIAALCKILAIVFAVLTILGGLLSSSFYGDLLGIGVLLGAIIGLIVSLIPAAIVYIFWRVIGESISVQLDIEENTRRTAAFLEQRLQ
jgi:hypothetical protein